MPEFNAHHALREAGERHEQLSVGDKLVPISAAVIAVLAALATLFSNHSSVLGLEKRTLAGIFQTRAADSYNYYESSRIKIEVNQALLQSGVVASAGGSKTMSARIAKEQAKSQKVLADAQKNEKEADAYLHNAEQYMTSYEKFEYAATLFEVSIVMVSITALVRTRTFMYFGAAATVIGLGFFFAGFA